MILCTYYTYSLSSRSDYNLVGYLAIARCVVDIAPARRRSGNRNRRSTVYGDLDTLDSRSVRSPAGNIDLTELGDIVQIRPLRRRRNLAGWKGGIDAEIHRSNGYYLEGIRVRRLRR